MGARSWSGWSSRHDCEHVTCDSCEFWRKANDQRCCACVLAFPAFKRDNVRHKVGFTAAGRENLLVGGFIMFRVFVDFPFWSVRDSMCVTVGVYVQSSWSWAVFARIAETLAEGKRPALMWICIADSNIGASRSVPPNRLLSNMCLPYILFVKMFPCPVERFLFRILVVFNSSDYVILFY